MNSVDQSAIADDGDSASPVPLVSVIMPAYNAEKYVLEAVHSILNQDYEPVEILLIDDGSSDSTVDLVKQAAPQVHIIQQTNAGVAAARNTGLRHAHGELICFLDADDGWLPGKLAAQVDYLRQHPDVGLVFHKWFVWRPDEMGAYIKPPELAIPIAGEIDPSRSGWIYHQLLLDCIVHTSTVMIRREVVKEIGFFETTLINGEDYDYWLRVSRKYEIHKLTGVYSFYRAAAGSLTDTPKSENYGYRIIKGAINRWGLSSPDGASLSKTMANKRLAQLAFDYGYSHLHYGSVKLAKMAFLKALQHEPLKWRVFIYLIASLFRQFRNA